MLAGELYYSLGPELSNGRNAARRLCKKYNETDPEQTADREAILTELMGSIGKNCFLETPFRCDYGFNIHVGNNVFMNFNTVILDCAKVEIGDDVMFAPNVQLYTATHPTDPDLRCYPQLWELAKPIKIGNRVWLGGGVIVLPGVTIGDNTTIGAGSVVTKDIPANCVAVGNPCKVVKHLPVKEQQK
jgi:maltose O-acetyltransferase